MGIVDRMEKQIQERDEESYRDMMDLFVYLDKLDICGLDGVLSEIRDLAESGIYEELIAATDVEKYTDNIDFLGDLPKYRLGILAHDNLRTGGLLTTIFTKSIVVFKDLYTLYTFIECTYYMHKNHLNKEDMLNIYFSGVDERIIFALDRFDEVDLDDLPEPTSEYFQKLRNTRWEDKELFNKMKTLMGYMMDFVLDYPDIWKYDSTYRATEDLFIQFLAACNAVNNDRLGIGTEDTIRAYTTFFKLIKTDLTQYTAIPERIQDLDNHGGYLVCRKCGTYYQIPIGESPNDYSDTCECGGKLKYLGSLAKK